MEQNMFIRFNADEQLAEDAIIENGHPKLSGENLKQKIIGKVVRGDYLHGFKFIAVLNQDGTMEGENNFGAHYFGQWTIDLKENSFALVWDGAWDNTTTRAYDVDGEIRFYDCATGQWCTSFTKIEEGDAGMPLQI